MISRSPVLEIRASLGINCLKKHLSPPPKPQMYIMRSGILQLEETLITDTHLNLEAARGCLPYQ